MSSGLDGPGDLPGVPADERIYIQLAPGGEGFTAAFSVRPLGPGTPAGRPGTGGKAVFGLSGGKRMKALRSLDEEIRRADEVRLLCPALGEGEQTDDYRWILDSPELCLDFLLQAGELGDRAVIEWPRGDRLSIRGKAGASSVRASVRSVKDWFALTGEIRVDEETVVSLREACRMISEEEAASCPSGTVNFLPSPRNSAEGSGILPPPVTGREPTSGSLPSPPPWWNGSHPGRRISPATANGTGGWPSPRRRNS